MQIEAHLSDSDKREIAEAVAAILLAKLAPASKPPAAYLTEQEAAAHLGVEPHVLRDCRKRREISFHRVGKRVKYSPENLAEFKARTLHNGSAKK